MTVIGGLIAATLLTLLVLPAIARVVLGPKEGLSNDKLDDVTPTPAAAQ